MPDFKVLTSRTAVLAVENVDTDQICPARFLTTTTREGLGKFLFADWRYDAEGNPRAEFVLNTTGSQGASILVAGANFGCGSSREHAPWALLDYGFRAVVSTSIADIFRGNALKNGLLPVVVDGAFHETLVSQPGTSVTIDLEAQTIAAAGKTARFEIDPFSRYCLLRGIDELGFLLDQGAAIAAFESQRTSPPFDTYANHGVS